MICPHCDATVLSTSQPIKEATTAQHFDLPKGEPARFVRNGILETCQCTDCAALAATPAVGGEEVRGHLYNILGAEMLAVGIMANEAQTLAVTDAALAAQPASPLRGRERIAMIRRYVKNARGAIESGQVTDKDVHGTLTKVIAMLDAFSASPPEHAASSNKDHSK